MSGINRHTPACATTRDAERACIPAAVLGGCCEDCIYRRACLVKTLRVHSQETGRLGGEPAGREESRASHSSVFQKVRMKGNKAGGPPLVNPGEEEAFALFNSIFEAYVRQNGPVDESKPPNVEVIAVSNNRAERRMHMKNKTLHHSTPADAKSRPHGRRRLLYSGAAGLGRGQSAPCLRRCRGSGRSARLQSEGPRVHRRRVCSQAVSRLTA